MGSAHAGGPRAEELRWSPDGAPIYFAGLKVGVSNLYDYTLDPVAIKKLSADAFADLHPAWSPDGSELVVNDDNIFDYEDRNTFPSASKL